MPHDPSWRAVTPEEIYDTIFSSTRFGAGYDTDEVDDFLDSTCEMRRKTPDATWERRIWCCRSHLGEQTGHPGRILGDDVGVGGADQVTQALRGTAPGLTAR